MSVCVCVCVCVPPRTLVNGQPVKDRVPVRHGGRILLGNNHLFRLSCPRPPSEEPPPEQDRLMDYEEAMKEISLIELTNGGWGGGGTWCEGVWPPSADPVYSKMHQKLSEKHKAEKEGEWVWSELWAGLFTCHVCVCVCVQTPCWHSG